jgi:hypothetical protein
MNYTKKQLRTLEYLAYMESREYLGNGRSYRCICNDCHIEETIHSAGTVSALFMTEHMGHNTFIKYYGY